jgi:hypothetical protein
VCPAPGIIHHDHECNGCTTEDIERIVTLVQALRVWVGS